MKGCECGHPRKARLTRAEISAYTKLRGYPIKVCLLCGHEVLSPRTAHDVRKLSAWGGRLAHKACVKRLEKTGCVPG